MAAIKVHGLAFSTAAMRVLAVLHEKDLEFELVPVNMATGEHKKEPFLSLNMLSSKQHINALLPVYLQPFGQIPAFEDGDLKMFESRAITQYLAHTYKDRGTELLFAEPKKMAEMSVWQEVEAQKYDPVAAKLCFQLFYKRMLGMGEPDEALAEELQVSLGKVLDVYEARLAGSKYMSGDHFGLADLHHLPTVNCLMGTPAKAVFEARPNVSRWVADILARPAWAKVLAMQNSS
ncbi:hypothetical protein Taro_029769 [Colocasia esculenta]|uniref:glutathione transferase n=1 Tax=Colocasia esculenta TaxID=4460 RepID=A0A843VQ07_COLES|nr:hypothetical protein [Colocasia esculenta]